MQMLTRHRFLNRAILLLLLAVGLVPVSWSLARARYSPPQTESFALTSYRAGTSTDRIIKSLQSRLQKAPEDWRAYSQLGLGYLQKARETGDPLYYQKADDVLQKALRLTPADYVAISGMGALALARHQFHSALAWGERARQINPHRPYAYGVVADAQIELGRYDEAAQILQTMVDLRPDFNSYSRISYIRELHGDTDGALDMMQRAVDAGGASAEHAAWARTQLGNLFFNLGKLTDAEGEYLAALRNLPNYVYALAGLGRVRAAQDRMAEAIALLAQASQVMPLPEFVIALGDLYLATGQSEAARRRYELVRFIQRVYEANGVDLDLEIALFDADHGQVPTATVAQARRAYVRRPSIHGADVLAWALYQAGEYRQARSYSQQALRLGTQDALMMFHAGMIAYRLGDYAGARAYLERALTTKPYFSILYGGDARRTRDRLRGTTDLQRAEPRR